MKWNQRTFRFRESSGLGEARGNLCHEKQSFFRKSTGRRQMPSISRPYCLGSTRPNYPGFHNVHPSDFH